MTKERQQELAQQAIRMTCDGIADFLCEKNNSYGNSVYEPVSVFSKASAFERIGVRIDDKISRLMSGNEFPGDDTEKDITGYFLLKMAFDEYQSLKINEEAKIARCVNP